MTPSGWSLRRVLGREVFTDPQGGEWVRATPEVAEVCYLVRARGVPHLYLKRGSAERIVKLAARKERRLERRMRRLERRRVVVKQAMDEEVV